MTSHFFGARFGRQIEVKFEIQSEESAETIAERLREHLSFSIERIDRQENMDFHICVTDGRANSPPTKCFWRVSKSEYDFSICIDGIRKIDGGDRFQAEVKSVLDFAIISGPRRWSITSVILESWVGLIFESRGGVRLHALAIEKNEKALICIAPSGWGKSTLAISAGPSALADEVVYFENGCLLAQSFAIRLKEEQLRLQKVETLRGQRSVLKISNSPRIVPVGVVSIGRWAQDASERIGVLIFFWRVFWGLGLQQNPELTLSSQTAVLWMKVGFHRLRFFYWTLRQGLFSQREEQFKRSSRTNL